MIYISNMETGQIKRVKELPNYVLPVGVCGRTSAVVLDSNDYYMLQHCFSSPEDSYEALLSHVRGRAGEELRGAIAELSFVLPDDWKSALQMRKVRDLFFFDEEDKWNSNEHVLSTMLYEEVSKSFS